MLSSLIGFTEWLFTSETLKTLQLFKYYVNSNSFNVALQASPETVFGDSHVTKMSLIDFITINTL